MHTFFKFIELVKMNKIEHFALNTSTLKPLNMKKSWVKTKANISKSLWSLSQWDQIILTFVIHSPMLDLIPESTDPNNKAFYYLCAHFLILNLTSESTEPIYTNVLQFALFCSLRSWKGRVDTRNNKTEPRINTVSHGFLAKETCFFQPLLFGWGEGEEGKRSFHFDLNCNIHTKPKWSLRYVTSLL